jgi:hypothetical protein
MPPRGQQSPMLPEPAARRLRVLQVLVGALMMGLLSASVVMALLVVIGHRPASPGLAPTFAFIVPGLFVTTLVVSVLVGRVLATQARQQWEGTPEPKDAALFAMPKFEVRAIFRGALLEGPGLFGAVATLLTGEFLFLIVPGLSLIGLAAMFPTRDRVLDFVDQVTGRRGV